MLTLLVILSKGKRRYCAGFQPLPEPAMPTAVRALCGEVASRNLPAQLNAFSTKDIFLDTAV
jgi:hypothetical protein